MVLVNNFSSHETAFTEEIFKNFLGIKKKFSDLCSELSNVTEVLRPPDALSMAEFYL